VLGLGVGAGWGWVRVGGWVSELCATGARTEHTTCGLKRRRRRRRRDE